MQQRKTTLVLLASALLLGAAALPASAVDLNIGNSGNGVSIGGDTGTGTSAGLGVTTNNGPLVSVGNNGTGSASGTINLGSVTSLVPSLGGGGGTPGPTPGPTPIPGPSPTPGPAPIVNPGGGGVIYVGSGAVSPAEYNDPALRNRCRSIIAHPFQYDSELVRLCRIVNRIKPLG